MTNTEMMYVLNSKCTWCRSFKVSCHSWMNVIKNWPENVRNHKNMLNFSQNEIISSECIYTEYLHTGSSLYRLIISVDLAKVLSLSNNKMHWMPDLIWTRLICLLITRFAFILWISLKCWSISVFSSRKWNLWQIFFGFSPSKMWN